MKSRRVSGTYQVRIRFRVHSPGEWLGGTYGKATRPFGLEALRAAGDKPFWAGELLSEPIQFTRREDPGRADE